MSGPQRQPTSRRSRRVARSPHELERRGYHLKTLYEVSREITGLVDTASIVKNFLMMVVGTLGVERGAIVMADSKHNTTTALSQRGCEAEVETALAPAV